tara:strand:+ start:8102 stop:8692 length:591 start_codon:yes stop_codon:yes gene_type:complete
MEIKKVFSNRNNLINGPLEIIPKLFRDERGYFFESFNQNKFNEVLNSKIVFVQDNQSKSSKNVLRGLHYQISPFAQGKLVRVIKGVIYDVIVDLRKNSTTFGEWAGIELNDNKQNQYWIPTGFAHGFITISDEAIVLYKTTNYWSSVHEKSLLWSDKHIKINWQQAKYNIGKPIISEKDKLGLSFEELNNKGDFFL